MRQSSDGLEKGLRQLANAAPQGAPAELGASLRGAYARHHARRRQKRMEMMAAVGACAVVSLLWVRGSHSTRRDVPRQVAVQIPAAPATAATTSGSATITAPAVHARAAGKMKAKRAGAVRAAARRPRAAESDARDFVALPMFDPAIPVGPSRIVRLEMPGSALQLVGFPVNEDLLQRRVLTDMLIGQDGTPYAVRLVRTQSNH